MASSPYPTPDVESESGFSIWLIRLPILFFTGFVLFMLLLVMFVAVFQVQYRGRIVPNVSAYGVELGGMTASEAAAALDAQFAAESARSFTFRDAEQTWTITAAELGLRYDADATAQQAAGIGRGANPFANTLDQLLVWLNGETLTPTLTYDQNIALARLNAIAESINRYPTDATLTISGTDVNITPGAVGRTVDVMATLGRLDAAMLIGSAASAQDGGMPTEIALVIAETPPVVADVEAAAQRARTALSAPVTLIADDGFGSPLGPWTASIEQIAALLRVSTVRDETTGALRYEIDVNTGAFAPYLENLADGLIVAPENGRFQFNDDTRQLEVTQRSRSGRTLNVAQTIANMETAIFSESNRFAPLAFDYQLPPYHDNVTAAELGIRELVAEGVSQYAGSTQARIDNILTSAARFNGLIIAPGEIFSFNRYVGDISPEAGYVSSAVIYGGRTIQGVGGGVCQVSTTAFRAAFYGGYPIVERYAHGYRVGFYERGDPEGVGMDAAIYTPDLDFRFLNDTPHHLLIETSVFPATSTVQFRFYSTSTGRQVIKQGPEVRDVRAPLPTRYEVNPQFTPGQELQVDWGAEGAYVEVTRIILDANGTEIDREIFASQYQPWGSIVQVAPGDGRATS
ncbi:MAG: VanW family protein [bacterium]|nr:VanW family protein [bacterium]